MPALDACGRALALTARRAEFAALAALSAAALVAWVRFPVLPTYDSLASLVWGRELLHGHLPQFAAYQAPTEHPLWVAVSAVLAIGGQSAARALTALTVASFVALIAGTYDLGRTVFGRTAAAAAALLLLSRLNFGFYAAFGFVDVPFAALVVWGAALEARHPHRGTPVALLFLLAGLLRPEGWAFALMYAIWCARPLDRAGRARSLAWFAAAPVLWCLTDLVVTGDPLFSWMYTTGEAQLLGRQRGPLDVPHALLAALDELLKAPVLVAGLAGLIVALRTRGAAAIRVPLAMLVIGALTFATVLLGGVSGQVPRYAGVTAVAIVLFAGAFLATLVRAPAAARARVGWAAVAVAAVAGAVWTAAHVHPASVTSDLRFRHEVEVDLTRVLRAPVVRHAERCGPLGLPTHKLVPAAIWTGNLRPSGVVARTDVRAAHPGVVLLLLGTRLLGHPGYGSFGARTFSPALLTQVPPTGYERRGRSRFFAIYADCQR